MSSTPKSCSSDEVPSDAELLGHEGLDDEYYGDESSQPAFDSGDWGTDARDRYKAIINENAGIDERSYGSDDLLLNFVIAEPSSNAIASYLSEPKSRIWYDRAHKRRSFTPEECSDTTLFTNRLHQWEQCGPKDGLKYAPPAQPERLDVSSGISFPKIDPLPGAFRLLVLLPHHGDLSSPVRCYLLVSLLSLHSCYIAVRYSRGNPVFTGDIFIDNLPAKVSLNLENFLRHIRDRDVGRTLWIREVCLNIYDAHDRQASFRLSYQRFIENCSCGILEMDKVMEGLEDARLLSYANDADHAKVWNEVVELSEMPWHRPCHPSDNRDVGVDLSQEQIDDLPFYRYVPLDLVAREVRLLTLYPADDFDDPIVVDISHAPLRGGLTYAALSYTWGSGELTSIIRAGSSKMRITSNLDAALRRVRRRDPTILWVDAISIDQSNVREKSRQINKMQEIFERAYAVYVWLGLGAAGSNLKSATDFIVELGSEETIFETDEDGEVTDPIVLKKTERFARAWADLYRFLKAPLFTRRWCIQEIASATIPTIIDATDKVFPWERLLPATEIMRWYFREIFDMWQELGMMDFIHEHTELKEMTRPWCYYFGLEEVHAQFHHIKTLTYIRELRKNNVEPSFLLLALLTTDAQCAHPQDRLFSLWSLARDSKDLFAKVAYSEKTEETYTAFAKSYAVQTRSLDVICASQFPAAGSIQVADPSYISDLELPSWSPDWRQHFKLYPLVRRMILYNDNLDCVPRLEIDIAPYHADTFESKLAVPSNDTGHESSKDDAKEPPKPTRLPFSFDGRVLVASGVILDTISYVVPFNELVRPHRSWSTAVLERCSSASRRSPYDDPLSALQSMMIGEPEGSVKVLETEEDNEFDGGVGALMILYTYGKEEFKYGNCKLSHLTRVIYMLKGRTLVITEKGYMGLAPWHVKEGFKLAILLGCSVPVLLEDISREDAEERRGMCFTVNNPNGVVETCNESLRGTNEGLYFRGDCYVQGWMEGAVLKEFGDTTEEAWKSIRKREKLRIY